MIYAQASPASPVDEYKEVEEDKVAQYDITTQKLFILKVFGLLTLMIILTSALISINVFVPQIKAFNAHYRWFALILLIPTLILLIICHCTSKIFPLNFIMLTLFTCCFGWMVGVFVSSYNAYEILIAAIVTVLLVICLSGFVLISKVNLNWMGMGLFVAISGFVMVSLLVIVLGFFIKIGRWWLIGISGFGAVLMCLFILYDTSMIIHYFTPDEVIPAAINLYIDIINLFQYVLALTRLIGNND
jgi:FtsH-binding integral membrane protein